MHERSTNSNIDSSINHSATDQQIRMTELHTTAGE